MDLLDEYFDGAFMEFTDANSLAGFDAEDGLRERIADAETYQAARGLLEKLLPGAGFPAEGIAFARADQAAL